MAEIFEDLSGLGLTSTENIDIYKKKEELTKSQTKVRIKPIEEIIYERKITCPVCERDIKFKAVKSGQLKLERTDLDLRPIYDQLEPALYEVIACNICGYAALKRVFNTISSTKQNIIKEKVAQQFTGKPYPEIYTYEIAIERYKLALYDAIQIEAKDSEKAYLCLKIAWLYRGYYESLEINENENKIENYKSSEITFMKHAVNGFKIAYEQEKFPVLDLSEVTVVYLIGELSRRIGDLEAASKWISQVIVSKEANNRLKERARESKSLILNAKKC